MKLLRPMFTYSFFKEFLFWLHIVYILLTLKRLVAMDCLQVFCDYYWSYFYEVRPGYVVGVGVVSRLVVYQGAMVVEAVVMDYRLANMYSVAMRPALGSQDYSIASSCYDVSTCWHYFCDQRVGQPIAWVIGTSSMDWLNVMTAEMFDFHWGMKIVYFCGTCHRYDFASFSSDYSKRTQTSI